MTNSNVGEKGDYIKPVSIIRKGLKNAHFEAVTSTLFGNLLAGPYLTGYLLHLGFNSEQIGFVTAIPLLSNALIIILSAFLMEKYTNRYRFSLVTLFFHRLLLSSGGLIPFIFPKGWWIQAFTALYIIVSFFGSLSMAPFTTLFADLVPKRLRAKYLGFRFTLTGISASFILLAAGWGLDRVSESAGFALLYAVGLVVGAINMAFIARYPNLPYKPSNTGMSLKYLYKPFRDSSFIKSILFVSLWAMAQGSTISLFSYVMLDIMKISYEWVGISNTILSLVSIAAYSIWGRLNANKSTRSLLLWVFPMNAAAIILWGLQAFAPITFMLIVVYTLLGASMAGFVLLVFNFVISETPKEERSMYYAVYASITGLFGFLGPLLGGRVFTYIKSWPIWFQEYGLFVCIGLIMLLVSLTVSFRIFGVKTYKSSIVSMDLDKKA